MKKVFIDTNIFIDYIDNREGAGLAQNIFNIAAKGKIILYASTLTFANMAYVIKKRRTREEVLNILDHFEQCVEVLPMDRQQLRNAIDQPCKDFEDMLQYQCAAAGNCEVFVTNNLKDFREFCELPLLSSREFLLHYLRGME